MSPSLRHLALLFALLPQLFLAAFAPAFVVCQEDGGDQVVELSLSGCCDEAPVSEGLEPCAPEEECVDCSKEECGDCLDAALSVSLRRDERAAEVAAGPLTLPAPRWSWIAHPRPLAAPRPSLASDPVLAAVRTINLRC